ncbi:hypothetical protein [Synechocystis salina]|uniref:hypothetical protein n=1 Tax=Synechocystis salina TaxID=945780 RepID=UPI001D15D3AF|nr:hypothetical protein [Synechocystis salina]
MESLNPIAVQELLAGYVLEDLTPAEQAQVEELLSQNPALVQEVEQLRATLNLLPLGLSSADVPPPLLLSPSPVNQFSPSVVKSTPKFPWGKIALGGLLATAIAVWAGKIIDSINSWPPLSKPIRHCNRCLTPRGTSNKPNNYRPIARWSIFSRNRTKTF